jgi:hypothetical protein
MNENSKNDKMKNVEMKRILEAFGWEKHYLKCGGSLQEKQWLNERGEK